MRPWYTSFRDRGIFHPKPNENRSQTYTCQKIAFSHLFQFTELHSSHTLIPLSSDTYTELKDILFDDLLAADVSASEAVTMTVDSVVRCGMVVPWNKKIYKMSRKLVSRHVPFVKKILNVILWTTCLEWVIYKCFLYGMEHQWQWTTDKHFWFAPFDLDLKASKQRN